MQFVPTAEGYYDFQQNKYIYNYVDHLGNVRLSYTKSASGTEIIEENNYYPFGLKHEGYNVLTGNPKYNYKYNGKELQESGMYDYGARFYMPDLGRWGVIDPLAEKSRRFSAYTYAFNNPVRFIDPDGRDPIDYVNENGNKIGTDGTDVEGTLMVSNRDDQRAIKTAEKKGEHISTDKLSELNSNMIVPFDNELRETTNVINKEQANGGLREEASSIGSNGEVLRSPTGPASTISADGTKGTATTDIQFNGILQGIPVTGIHSHNTGILEGEGTTIYPLDALTPTPGVDNVSFSNFHTNIITGRLEKGSTLNITKKIGGGYNDTRPIGAAVYNRDGSFRMKLTTKVINNILKRNEK